MSRSGLCRAVLRLAEKADPTYQQLRCEVQHSAVNGVDETGWGVEATLHWLWVAVNPEITV